MLHYTAEGALLYDDFHVFPYTHDTVLYYRVPIVLVKPNKIFKNCKRKWNDKKKFL